MIYWRGPFIRFGCRGLSWGEDDGDDDDEMELFTKRGGIVKLRRSSCDSTRVGFNTGRAGHLSAWPNPNDDDDDGGGR